jgi:hypothetical protein
VDDTEGGKPRRDVVDRKEKRKKKKRKKKKKEKIKSSAVSAGMSS